MASGFPADIGADIRWDIGARPAVPRMRRPIIGRPLGATPAEVGGAGIGDLGLFGPCADLRAYARAREARNCLSVIGYVAARCAAAQACGRALREGRRSFCPPGVWIPSAPGVRSFTVSVRDDHNRAARFAGAASRLARTRTPTIPPEGADGRRFRTLQGEVTERSLLIAAVRKEAGEGPDPDDPQGELAYGFLERTVR